MSESDQRLRVVLFANTDWYLYNFRRSLAAALCSAGAAPLLISPPGPHGERLRTLGFEWEAVPMQRRSLNPIRELGLIVHIARLLRRERPALIHAFTIKCAIYGSIAARLARVPARVNAVTGMGYVFTSDDLHARMLRPLVRRLLHSALDSPKSMLILQNDDDLRFFSEQKIVPTSRIRVIRGSGVDCVRFQPGPRQNGRAVLRVVLATRLLRDKGVEEFIEAARELSRERPAIEFVVAGTPDPGNPASVDEQSIRGWVTEGIIDWRGHVEDMPALFGDADIAVLPSYREGLPKSLIEAAACELALVTTDVPGCREVVEHGVTGLLVPPRSAAALAAAIRRLRDDSALRRRLAVAARRKAILQFDDRVVIRDTFEVYNHLLGDRVWRRPAGDDNFDVSRLSN